MKLSTEQVSARIQSIVLEREIAIRESRSIIADSARLMERTRLLLDRIQRRLS